VRFKILTLFFFLISAYLVRSQTVRLFSDKEIDKKMNFYLQKADSCKINFDYSDSFKYISEVLSYARKNNNRNAEIFCNIKLIELYRHAALFEKADVYLKKATVLIKAHGDKVSDYNLMYYYNRKAALFSEYYRIPDSTLYYSKKALVLSEKLQNSAIRFTSLMEIGYAHEKKNNLQEAVNYYQKSYELSKKNRKIAESCDALVNTARVFEKMKNYKKALEKCNEGLVILEQKDNFFQKLLFYDIKQKTFEKLGDKTAAYENLKLRLKYTDLYYEKNASDKLLEEGKQYELLEKDRQIFKNKQDINEVKKNQLLLMSILLLFVLGLLSLLYYSKKNKIANKQLDFLSKENAFLLNEAKHRIKNNLQIIIVQVSEEIDKMQNTNSDYVAIKKILVKVESISTLHRHLYQSKDKKSVDIQEYLNEIISNFSDIFEEKEIEVNYKLTKLNVSIDLAMYLGLLTTELFINSIKYAFTNQKVKIISLQVYNNLNILHLEYNDNGEEAIGKQIEPNLVTKICRQIKADYKIESNFGFEIFVSKDLTNSNG